MRVIQIYGDLLFDLCLSILWDWTNAQVAFKQVINKLDATRSKSNRYQENERASIFHCAIVFLRPFAIDHAKRLGKAEQLSLDSLPYGDVRLKKLPEFFYRLNDNEKILLIIREKFGFTMKEIATSTGIPEGANKVCRAQALRALEGWIWGNEVRTQLQDGTDCFSFDSSLSDLLDGSLIRNQQRELEKHLANCRECLEHYKHYKTLCKSIAEFPRNSLPIPIRKADFSQIIPRATILGKARSQWARLPWYIRTSTEGLSIVGILILMLALIPKVRVLYEQSLERGLETYHLNLSDSETQLTTLNTTAKEGSVQNLDEFKLPQSESSEHLDSTGDSVVESESEPEMNANLSLQNRNPHIWRFNLRTDSLEESRASVRLILLDILSKESKKPVKEIPEQIVSGSSVPGGVQFDLLVPESSISSLKQKIERLVPKTSTATPRTGPESEGQVQAQQSHLRINPTENFSWYKSKAKGQFPKGRTRLVVWLTEF